MLFCSFEKICHLTKYFFLEIVRTNTQPKLGGGPIRPCGKVQRKCHMCFNLLAPDQLSIFIPNLNKKKYCDRKNNVSTLKLCKNLTGIWNFATMLKKYTSIVTQRNNLFQWKMKMPERWRPSLVVPSLSVFAITWCHMLIYMTKMADCSAALTNRQTHTETHQTDFILLTADAGGKK